MKLHKQESFGWLCEMKESQILDNWSWGKYSPGFSSHCSSSAPDSLTRQLYTSLQTSLSSVSWNQLHISARSDFKSCPWGQGVCQRQALKTSLPGKSCWYFRDLDAPPPLAICLQMSYLEFPSLFCCQSAAKTNAPVSTVRSKVIFLAWWSFKEELWLCQLCMSNTTGLIPAFLPGIKSQGLSLTPEKAQDAQPWAAGCAIKSSHALRVISALTTTLEKVSVATCSNPMAKANPAAALLTSQLLLTLQCGRRQICLKLGTEILQLWDFWTAGSCQPCTDTDFSANFPSLMYFQC